MPLVQHHDGNYAFLPGMPPFSSGVIALPGFAIVRATLRHPLPYREGLTMAAQHIQEQGRSVHALCALELRMPAPLAREAFDHFNQEYLTVLAELGLLLDAQSPLARTNVAPAVHAPDVPALYAFCYTVPIADSATQAPTFVVSGAGEVRGWAFAPETIVRFGEVSSGALREKAAQVVQTISTRLSRLNVTWAEAMEAAVYTVHPLQPFLVSEILDVIGQASVHGVHWYYSRPPLEGLEFEMDIRGVQRELHLS